mgnify:CR=1 FL=1
MPVLSLRNVFRGRVIEVNVERVELPNKAVADLEIIHHPGGAAIVAINERREICLLRQFRKAPVGWLGELRAAKIDHREPPLQTAQRELEEEAGVTAASWQSLGDMVSSPGVFTEVIHLYLATGLQMAAAKPEEHEVLEVHWKPLDEAVQMACDGELRDAKSLVGIFRAAAQLR